MVGSRGREEGTCLLPKGQAKEGCGGASVLQPQSFDAALFLNVVDSLWWGESCCESPATMLLNSVHDLQQARLDANDHGTHAEVIKRRMSHSSSKIKQMVRAT